MVFLGIAEFICLIGIPVTLVGFLIQLARKKPNKKIWGITLIGFLAIFVVCVAITPTPESEEESEKNIAATVDEDVSEPMEDAQSTVISESEPTEEPKQESEKTEAEKFAESKEISVELAESLESVLADMELTDKSKVGVFHYDLSDVYEWKQIDDWAYGERYSAFMDMEHVWYIYVKDDVVVGVRDGHGNIFYSEE